MAGVAEAAAAAVAAAAAAAVVAVAAAAAASAAVAAAAVAAAEAASFHPFSAAACPRLLAGLAFPWCRVLSCDPCEGACAAGWGAARQLPLAAVSASSDLAACASAASGDLLLNSQQRGEVSFRTELMLIHKQEYTDKQTNKKCKAKMQNLQEQN